MGINWITAVKSESSKLWGLHEEILFQLLVQLEAKGYITLYNSEYNFIDLLLLEDASKSIILIAGVNWFYS